MTEQDVRSIVRRRHFLGAVATAGCASQTQPPAGTAHSTSGGESDPSAARDPAGVEETPKSPLPLRELGGSGERVSALGLGGYHLGIPSEAEAERIMHAAIASGMTFFDNCWDYHDGESERRMGRALREGKREQVFLMTKIDGRTKAAAADQIDDCLRRLQTDRIDLMQIHEVIRDKDPAWVFGDDGAIAALRDAQQAGKIRYVGFTGHKSPGIHLSMLNEAEKYDFRFDAVQMPLNVLDPHYESFEKEVLPRLAQQDIAVLGMKPLASGAALKTGVVSAEECLRYALSLPTSVVITGCDSMDILEQALGVGRDFAPLSETEKKTLLTKTQPFGKSGDLERFKTTAQFDATSRNEHWLTTGEL